MIEVTYCERIGKQLYELIDAEFNQFAIDNGVSCDYHSFAFTAKEEDKIVGVITGHTYYKEIHIDDLIVLKKYRYNHIGSKLVKAVEDFYKEKGFEYINLTTHEFQAPEFYKKCGYKIEFIRENKDNPKLTKYFFVKYY